ncbi:MAG TPA: sugar phosphate nucleotidyltransferase [Candidatus Acidoferrales bacterium]|jgi:mannose-1-phosphate guanylyltransferase|nr:sugar phosphate nucleotidyltransferase [Candidatus Acidoferrales bacterium]
MNAKTKSDIKNRYVIIMAGGRGERFWPLSREKMPKQLLALLGKKSFLQEAVERVLPLVPAKNIFIITNEAQLPEVRKQLPKIPKANLIAEPVGRDTCAAVTLGAALVGARSTMGVMAVLPADHVIPDPKKFQQVLGDAFDLASRGQAIVTIGIKATEPATGYGYIRVGNELPAPDGAKKYKTTFFKAEQFVEKPNFERAIEYVNSGQYRWNAGMFVWSFVTITNGLEKHQPEMFAACQRWFKVANKPAKLAKVLAKEYPAIKKISIDFALMEHAQNVIVADGTFEWDDLGAWPALARHLKTDPEGNCAVADFIHVDGARNIIYDARTKNKTPIAIVGLRDSILVQTDDAVLLAHKSQAQKVKELVRKLSEDAKLKKLV